MGLKRTPLFSMHQKYQGGETGVGTVSGTVP
jgi:hypothetical protein